MHHKIIKFAVMTIEQLYKTYIEQLKSIYDEREASNIADWAFESIAGIKRIERTINKEKELNNVTTEKLHNVLGELLQHKPIQYVLGEAWFYKMKFFVNEHVLIPRPETEELVEWIIKEVKSKNEKLKIIDIGTGSGCLAIALKKELPSADILAIDVSVEALFVAQKNALDLNTNIELLQLDFLDENTSNELAVFDIIVSNPPYIPEKEKNILQKNIVAYEPHAALFVSDAKPFIFYKKIALFALKHLDTHGKIYVEVHEKYAAEVSNIFSQYNFKSTIKKDIYGKERMICAER